MIILTHEILIKEGIRETFKRFDVVMIYLVIDRYLKNEDNPFELYGKLQHLRNSKNFEKKSEWELNLSHGIDCIKQYIKLFSGEKKSVNLVRMDRIDYTTLDNSHIELAPNLRLTNGSHRLATATYFKIDLMDIILGPEPVPEGFGFQLNWLQKYFTKEEQEQVFGAIERIKKDYGF